MMGDNVTMTAEANVAPEDLCDKAIKLARRVQALSDDAIYRITLVKQADVWSVLVEGEGERVEVVR
jgi:hypothetical protein